MSYGVTPAIVSSRCNGLIFLDSAVGPPAIAATKPSLADVTREIVMATRRVSGVLRSKGIDPATVTEATTPETWAAAHEMTLSIVMPIVLSSRERLTTDLAEFYASMYREARASLVSGAGAGLGDARPVNDGAASISRGTTAPSEPLPRNIADRLWRSGGV